MNDRRLKKSTTVKVRRKMSETTDPDITVGMPTQIHIRLYSHTYKFYSLAHTPSKDITTFILKFYI
jgi:hypothetical protein